MIHSLRVFCYLCAAFLLLSCDKVIEVPKPATGTQLYFPPASGQQWQTQSATALGWNQDALTALYSYLESKNTKAFIILKDGRIVSERYYGTFTADSNWYWASAGKTMTAVLVGIAQQQQLLSINDAVSKYLGQGWTSAPLQKENLITIRHQLAMTTGLDDGYTDTDCTLPACLTYKADAGTRWAYHNAPYTLLDKVIEKAANMSYNAFFQQKIRDKIGMNGLWIKTADNNNLYFSTARSMARFGLLLLANGQWNGTAILADTAYMRQQVNSSQNLNLSYGWLTWLNGKNSFMLPTLQNVFPGSLIPQAPADLYAALGKYDQKIYVVPSQQLVIIRMGNAAEATRLGPSSFDNELWAKLKVILGY